jgi:hypothetical protein
MRACVCGIPYLCFKSCAPKLPLTCVCEKLRLTGLLVLSLSHQSETTLVLGS